MGLSGMVEGGGMELHKLHVGHRTLGPVDHGLAVARGNHGVGGGLVDGSAASGTHECHLAEIGVHLLGFGIEHVGTIALDIGGAAGHPCAQVVLGDDFHGKMVFLDDDVGAAAHCLHQPTLYLGSRIVGMVEDAELGVSTLPMEVEVAVVLAVEVHAPVHQFADLFRSVLHYLFHRLGVTDIVTRNHGVLYMLLEIVEFQIGDRCDASLCKGGVGLIQ